MPDLTKFMEELQALQEKHEVELVMDLAPLLVPRVVKGQVLVTLEWEREPQIVARAKE